MKINVIRSVMSVDKKLTDKQLKFIDEYMIELNATKAYVAAGYSAKLAHTNGAKLLQNTTIREEIDRRKAASAIQAGVTRDEIIADLKAIKDSFKGADKYPPHAMKAIEILNKMLGYDAPTKIEHSGGMNLNLQIPGMESDDSEPDND